MCFSLWFHTTIQLPPLLSSASQLLWAYSSSFSSIHSFPLLLPVPLSPKLFALICPSLFPHSGLNDISIGPNFLVSWLSAQCSYWVELSVRRDDRVKGSEKPGFFSHSFFSWVVFPATATYPWLSTDGIHPLCSELLPHDPWAKFLHSGAIASLILSPLPPD